ncbi:hypothetical protein [Corynebacterium propinquum]|uniref:ABC transporter permease n=1 Tax=Corynebacterium propinquum TaxID=43769 RepID=A0ABT7G1C8_9CORY|nr:hypothetical protein [Corynebacterium propinquum]MDK4300534.1 hypothetical protein [Corynebacterium propinquum]QQU86270.1 hypothetical protein I6I70_00675 [Corynebacterium propinquum]
MTHTAAQPSLRVFTSLHWKLWKRHFNTNTSQIFIAILVAFYSFLGLAGLGAFTLLGAAEGEFMPMIYSLAAGTVGYWIAALLMPAGENQVDPARMAVLPLTEAVILRGSAVTSLLTVRGVLAIFNSLVMIVLGAVGLVHNGSGWGIAVWIPAVLGSFVITVAGGEALATLLGSVGNRKSSEKVAMASALGFVVLIFGFNVVANSRLDFSLPWETLLALVAWTPFGAAPGAAVAVLQAHWATALVQAAIAAVTVAVAWRVWRWALRRNAQTVTGDSGAAATGSEAGSVLLPGVRASASGAVFSLTLRYWRRDIRFTYSLVVMPLFLLMMLALAAINDQSFMAYLAVLFFVLFAAGMTSNALGYDGPSNWVHMSAGLAPRTLLWARTQAVLLLTLPTLVIYLVVLVVLGTEPTIVVALAVIAGSAVLLNAGLAALLAVWNPFQVSAPGTNPMKDKSGFSVGAVIMMLVSLLMVWLPLAPGIIMMIVGMNLGDGGVTQLSGLSTLFWAGVVLSLCVALAGLWLGHVAAANRLEKRWPEVLAKVRNFY